MSTSRHEYGAPDQQPDDVKLGELILYIAQQSEGDERFGATKLNKLLFYADFLHYVQYGRSITGQAYQRLEQGPAPRRLLPVRHRLTETEAALVVDRQFYGKRQQRLIALRDPDLTVFSATEIAVVHEVLRRCWGMNGGELSDASHRFLGWLWAESGETIPYNVALIQRRLPTAGEIRHGLELEAEYLAAQPQTRS